MCLPASLAPLQDRPFRLLYAGQVISLLGDGMAPVALAFAVLQLTGSANDLGWVLAARSGTLVSLLLISGVIADRVKSRRLLMVAADLVRFLTQSVTAALVLTGTAQLWELLILQAAYGAGMALFYPAITGLIPATVRPSALQQANALRAVASSGGQVVGPAIAGVIVASASPGWALAADALSFAVDACFLARLPAITAARTAERFGRHLLEGWRAFTSRTWVWTIVAGASLGNLLFAAVTVLGPFVAERRLGGPAGWGLIMAFVGVGSLVGGLLALRLRPAHPLRVGILTAWLLALPSLAWPRDGRSGRSRRPLSLPVAGTPSSMSSGRPRSSATCPPTSCRGSAPTTGSAHSLSSRWARPSSDRSAQRSEFRSPCSPQAPGSPSPSCRRSPFPASATSGPAVLRRSHRCRRGRRRVSEPLSWSD